jgi:hypothetical protein
MKLVDFDANPKLPVHRPPSIHEELIARHFSREEDDAVLVAMRNAVHDARLAADEIAKRHEAIMADELRTPIARQRAARQMAQRLLAGVSDKLNRAHAQAHAAVADIENLAPPPLKNIEATMAAQEMRGLLRSMTPKERNKIISDAIAADDNAVLSAIMHGHALASGLGPLEHNALQRRWQKSRYPQQVERRERLVKASDDLERIVHLFGAWTDGLTDAKAIAAAENRENQAKAAEKVAVP